MPKKRKEAGTRKVEKKIYILCEGADKHSEYAYLGALIKDTPIKGDKVQIELAPTKYNTGRELVEEASKKIDKKFKNIDEAWVVYDQDGYSLHKETFESAKEKGVKIAFSATAFEFWILLHYEYTTKQFPKSEDIIKELKDKNFIDDILVHHTKRYKEENDKESLSVSRELSWNNFYYALTEIKKVANKNNSQLYCFGKDFFATQTKYDWKNLIQQMLVI